MSNIIRWIARVIIIAIFIPVAVFYWIAMGFAYIFTMFCTLAD